MNPLRRSLSGIERATLRRGQTAADAKYSIGGRLKEMRDPSDTQLPAEKREGRGRAYNRTLVIKIDQETLEQIIARAKKAGTSKAEQVRLLLEWGLEAENV